MLFDVSFVDDSTVDIYSEPGTVVMFTGRHGTDADQLVAKSYLVVGTTYTVDYTEVFNYNTDVFLKEFPDVPFNSVLFKNI